MNRDVTVDVDAAALAEHVASRLSERVNEIHDEGTSPSVVLTGGTIANAIYRAVDAAAADWSAVDFYWGDERFVADGHADRNDQQARDAFLTRLAVPEDRLHRMPASDWGLSPGEAAEAYAGVLPAAPFDLVLLGMGPDGHIASLFPGFAQLHEADRLVVDVADSPKPPPNRLSLSLPRLNNSLSTWLLVSGSEKSGAVARALGDGTLEDTPAAAIQGLNETFWFLDEAAAAAL